MKSVSCLGLVEFTKSALIPIIRWMSLEIPIFYSSGDPFLLPVPPEEQAISSLKLVFKSVATQLALFAVPECFEKLRQSQAGGRHCLGSAREEGTGGHSRRYMRCPETRLSS